MTGSGVRGRKVWERERVAQEREERWESNGDVGE